MLPISIKSIMLMTLYSCALSERQFAIDEFGSMFGSVCADCDLKEAGQGPNPEHY